MARATERVALSTPGRRDRPRALGGRPAGTTRGWYACEQCAAEIPSKVLPIPGVATMVPQTFDTAAPHLPAVRARSAGPDGALVRAWVTFTPRTRASAYPGDQLRSPPTGPYDRARPRPAAVPSSGTYQHPPHRHGRRPSQAARRVLRPRDVPVPGCGWSRCPSSVACSAVSHGRPHGGGRHGSTTATASRSWARRRGGGRR